MGTGADMNLRPIIPVLAVAAALSLAAPAAAQTDAWNDARGDVPRGNIDIHQVLVHNRTGRLVVRLDTSNLSPRKSGGTTVYVDTRPAHPGPEYVMSGGTSAETDYYIWRTRGWRATGSMPLPCRLDMTIDRERDRVRWATGEGCLGRYGKVRVSARATRDKSDWSPRFHRFHPWVERG
jgi:hypothetical protein